MGLWVDHEDCERVIADSWCKGLTRVEMRSVINEISTYNLVHKKIKQLRFQLQQL